MLHLIYVLGPDKLRDWVQMEGGRGVRLKEKRRERGCGKGVREHQKKKSKRKNGPCGQGLSWTVCVCLSQREKRRN